MSVSLSDETIEAVANAVARILRNHPPGDFRAAESHSTTQSNPPSPQNPQGANGPGSGGQGDPWMNQNGGQQQQGQHQGQQQGQQAPGQYQGQQNQGFQGQGQQQQGGHNCAHGQMTFVPAGTNRNTNEPYNQYWKCPLQRGAQGRCRNVYA
jgi:hypothetical protein